MKFTINTEVFKSMISRAVKGAGLNKLIALTGLMSIELKDGILTTITTDGTNYLYVMEHNVPGEEFYITVSVEQFAKLISKMTSGDITLQVNNGVLEISGNGKYSMELPLDENGDLIKYPNPISELDIDSLPKSSVPLATIKTILNTIKPSLAVTFEMPVLTYYFVGSEVIATDGYKAASFNTELIADKEILVSAPYMDLFNVMTADTVEMTATDTETVAISNDCIIYGKQSEDITNYPVDAIENLVSEEYENVCKLNRQQLLNLLDRMLIFVGVYDDGAIKMTFSDKGIAFFNMSGKSYEMIEYSDNTAHSQFDCIIDINVFMQQVKAYNSDVIELHYGKDSNIKFVDDKIVQVISLNEEN